MLDNHEVKAEKTQKKNSLPESKMDSKTEGIMQNAEYAKYAEYAK
jgi:hypothetical protein